MISVLKKINSRLVIVIFIGILISLLGYFLQVQQFSAFPPVGDTYDELKGAFNGVNLINHGVPRSWSWFVEYGDFPIIHVRNSDLRIVEPYFDDPPLFALISGAYAISKGMTDLDKIDAGAMRWPMLKLGVLNIFLLFILVYLLKGPLEASVASLIYATVPTFVLGARLPIADNMVASAALFSLILFTFYMKSKSKIALFLCGLVGASAFLMKTPGIFVPASLIFLTLSFRKYKASIVVTIFTLGAIITWFAYGYYYNFELFIKLLSSYSGRELFMPSMIINLFEVFRIGEKAMSTDGWILWGWICVVIYSFIKSPNDDRLSKLILPITIGSYLVFFSIMSGHSKGWYRFPFFPFLSWAAAAVFLEILKNPRFLSVFFFASIPVSSSYIYGTGEYKWNPFEIKIYQLFLAALLAIPLFYEIYTNIKLKKALQIILILLFFFAIIYNIRTILFYQDQFWY